MSEKFEGRSLLPELMALQKQQPHRPCVEGSTGSVSSAFEQPMRKFTFEELTEEDPDA